MMKKLWIPAVALVFAVGLFALCAAWMARNPLPAASTLPPRDPARTGASLGEQAMERFDLPQMTQADDADAADAAAAEPLLAPPSAGERIPSPLFWMAAGALCASAGMLIATREKKRGLFAKG